MTVSRENQCDIAAEAISQLFSAAKAELTTIEANLWIREIERLGPEVSLSFVEFWISGGGQGSFQRAPKLQDFLHRADPLYVSAETALEILRVEVASTGPYSNPEIADHKLMAAVARLGGWAKVCQDMPDPSAEFAYKRFTERFRNAWMHSESLQIQKKLNPQPLLGLIAEPGQLRLAMETPDGALPAPENS